MFVWIPPGDLLALSAGQAVWRWIVRLGALGFFPLGLLDSSVVPVPGSMDALVVVLCARKENSWIWIYYAGMAAAGSLLGAWVTYRLARKGGKEALKRRLPSHVVKEMDERFARSGASAVFLPALLPPPAPMVPFLLAAGALQYPTKKFLLEYGAGRLIRFVVLGFLAARYGRDILQFFSQSGHPVRLVILGFAAVGIVIVFVLISLKRHGRPQTHH